MSAAAQRRRDVESRTALQCAYEMRRRYKLVSRAARCQLLWRQVTQSDGRTPDSTVATRFIPPVEQERGFQPEVVYGWAFTTSDPLLPLCTSWSITLTSQPDRHLSLQDSSVSVE